MMMTFLLATAIAGLISGILGYVSFDKILYQTMRSASPGKQIVYVVAILWIFTFGTGMTVMGMFLDIDNWSLIITAFFAVLSLFSVPGLMVVFAAYVLLSTGQFSNLSPLINEAATILIGLVTGIVVAMGISTPELSGLQAAMYQEVFEMIYIFKLLIGGFISAVIAGITKLVLSSIW